MYGALFYFALFVWASDITGVWDNGKGAEELKEGLIESYERPIAFCDCCEHIVGNQFFGSSLKKPEGIEQASMQGLLPL